LIQRLRETCLALPSLEFWHGRIMVINQTWNRMISHTSFVALALSILWAKTVLTSLLTDLIMYKFFHIPVNLLGNLALVIGLSTCSGYYSSLPYFCKRSRYYSSKSPPSRRWRLKYICWLARKSGFWPKFTSHKRCYGEWDGSQGQILPNVHAIPLTKMLSLLYMQQLRWAFWSSLPVGGAMYWQGIFQFNSVLSCIFWFNYGFGSYLFLILFVHSHFGWMYCFHQF
jgi:hypothetical protein